MNHINVANLAKNLNLILSDIIGQPVKLKIEEVAAGPRYLFKLHCSSNPIEQTPRMFKKVTIGLFNTAVSESAMTDNKLYCSVGFATESFGGGENFIELTRICFNKEGEILGSKSAQA